MDALEISLGSRGLRSDSKIVLHVVVDLLQVVGAVAQDDVQQFQHGDLAAVVGGHLPVKGFSVAAIQEGDDVFPDLVAVLDHLVSRMDILQAFVGGAHVLLTHAAHLVAKVGHLGERHDVHDSFPARPGAPRHIGVQLFLGELGGGPAGAAQDLLVLVCQPFGLTRQIDRHVQLERRYQLLGEIADDDFCVVDDGHRQGLDPSAAQVFHRLLVFQHVVVLVLNTVGLEELFQSPAAESTRLRINLNVHGTLHL